MTNIMLEHVDTECPLCSNSKAKILKLINSKDVAKHMKIPENDPKCDSITANVEKLWKSDFCYFVRCESCSFDFAVPNISGDSKFYSLIYDHALNYLDWKWDFNISYFIIEEIIRNYASNNFKLLEIGAGNGNFLKKIANNLIPKENILATEFSSYGKNEITKYGIQCFSLDIYDVDINEYAGYFDFVCLFQVLEHISNLNNFFNRITLLTKNDANLLITVPNNIHRLHFMNLGMDEDVPPIHVGRWNKNSFNILAKKHGWVVVNHKYQPSNYLGNILKYIFNKLMELHYLNPVHKIKIKLLRKIALTIVILPFFFLNINVIIGLLKKDLGVSQFVHFKKI